MNTQNAKVGDIIRYVGNLRDLSNGGLYYVHATEQRDSDTLAVFIDENGRRRALWTPDKYEVVGKLANTSEVSLPLVLDLLGKELNEGDTIVYPVSIDCMEILRIESMNRATMTAVCTYVGNAISGTITVGCLENRAVKIEQ
jgi:hypothetical protein